MGLLDRRIGLVAFALALMGCEFEEGSGHIVRERHDIPAVSRVHVGDGFDVEFRQGSASTLTIETDDNLMDDIEVDVHHGLVEIAWEREGSLYEPSQPVKVEVTLPALSFFEVSGGGKLVAREIAEDALVIKLTGGSVARVGQVWSNDLRVELSGGSRAEFELISAARLELESSGGSIMRGSGLVPALFAQVSDGGLVGGQDLITDRARLQLSGGSQVELTVTDALKVDASGGSQVEFSGDAAVDADLSGGSQVDRRH
jgi:hypothetical protein